MNCAPKNMNMPDMPASYGKLFGFNCNFENIRV